MDNDSHRLAVILHVDVVGSTTLVRHDEVLAHERIQASFQGVSDVLSARGGIVREVRGDALVAEFARASDAAIAGVAAQVDNQNRNAGITDEIVPQLRIGIALGEVVVSDNTVTGTGVILAQRLEQLAEPGEVVVQGAVRDAFSSRVPLVARALGEQPLKGFDEPVRAFQVALTPSTALPEPSTARAATKQAGGKSTTPSVAVLTFENPSGDPEQQFLADGLAEDISGALSRLRWLTVIARNSVRQLDVNAPLSQLAAELGVAFIVRGSVRRAGERLRITVVLEGTRSGEQIWSERYDRRVADLFEIEDDICACILARVEVEIGAAEQRRLRARPPAVLSAWEAYQCGLGARQGLVGVELVAAKDFFRQAMALDPNFSAPKAALALAIANELGWALVGPADRDAAVAEASALAAAAIRVDPREALGFAARSRLHVFEGENVAALDAAHAALERNPNSSTALLLRALALAVGDNPESALDDLQQAERLSPLDPYVLSMRYGVACVAYLRLGRYEEVIKWGEAGMQTLQSATWSCALAAAAHTALGSVPRAREIVLELLTRRADFTISGMLGRRKVGDPQFHAWLIERLREAGVPD